MRKSILMKKAGKFLFMSRSQKRSHRLVKWLADAIMIEMEKPYDEINVEFVESCENLLNTLMGEKKLSDKEINDRVNEIMERSGKNYAVPVRRRSKPALIALIAAVIFVLSCVTVCATTPISQYLLKALDLGLNQSVSDGKITFINNGERTLYGSIEEFIDSENLNICYPEAFPYNIKVEKILKYEDNQIVFVLSSPEMTFKIQQDRKLELPQDEDIEIVEYNNISFYIYDTEFSDYIFAYALIDDDLYSLSCDSKEKIIEMIYNLNFERLKSNENN